MTDRSTILREIGLTPIWTTRTASTPAVEVANTSRPAEAARDEHAPTIASEQSVQPDPGRDAAIANMSWDELIASVANCTACKLSKTRNKTVPGVGDRSPSWMVVGEAPGENEDKQGEPFVGKAGQLLDAMLAAVAKKRTQGVFITNVIKCRPPGNRNPEPDEIAACEPYLKRQIALASPKLLLAAGKFAAQTLLNRDDTVAAMRASGGQFAGIPVVVTYHPSYLLRSPLEKAKTWDDLIKARTLVA
jgi:uracil-DNA glycosylase